jgi:uncharacterized protein (DUF983 family)
MQQHNLHNKVNSIKYFCSMLKRIKSLLMFRCPGCETGQLFTKKNPYDLKNVVTMPERCQVCGQLTSLEVGFYWGAAYVSYGLAVLLCFTNFFIYYAFISIDSIQKVIIFILINAGILIALFPINMRLSRVIYLYIFVNKKDKYKSKKILKNDYSK